MSYVRIDDGPLIDAPNWKPTRRWLILLVVPFALWFFWSDSVSVKATAQLRQASMETSPFHPDRPIIGILSLSMSESFRKMHDLPADAPGAIPSPYVKWLESAGAQVIVIPHFWEPTRIMETVSKLSGVLFTGGDAGDLAWNTTTAMIYNEVVRRNRTDDPLALWATCLGYERVLQVVTNDEYNTVIEATLIDVSTPVEWTNTSNSGFSKFVGEHTLSRFSSHPIAYNYHTFGVTNSSWHVHADTLDPLFEILGWMKDPANDSAEPFIAMIEGKNGLPIWGVQFHPEKAMFEWGPTLHYPDTTTAVDANRRIADFFVQHVVGPFQKKKYSSHGNNNTFASFADVAQYSVYNYIPFVPGKSSGENAIPSFIEVYTINK
jgi:gamma-glutamyl hydrolase